MFSGLHLYTKDMITFLKYLYQLYQYNLPIYNKPGSVPTLDIHNVSSWQHYSQRAHSTLYIHFIGFIKPNRHLTCTDSTYPNPALNLPTQPNPTHTNPRIYLSFPNNSDLHHLLYCYVTEN